MTNNNENNESTKSASNGRTSSRGFASMDPKKQREIASKGGQAVSGNREHMAQIGRKGGEASGESRRNQNNDDKGNTSNTEPLNVNRDTAA
ncbi:MAG: hypothetical protein K0R82_660 [Flavipsychrobacter sp.]|nr:hypothetical protein [Flavipsychrobacter sp.]